MQKNRIGLNTHELITVKKLIPSKGRIFLAGLIDFFLAIGIFAGTVTLTIRISTLPPQFILFFISLPIYIVIFIISVLFNGTGPGMFFTGIIYIDGHLWKRFDGSMYLNFWLNSMLVNFKYSEIYGLFYYLGSQNNQTKAMEEEGVYYGKAKMFKKMKKNEELPSFKKLDPSKEDESSFHFNL